ncbi:hypothetical protein HDU87_007583 [Geranomyces variabilis]|uniref:Uncharacterized protein n=1 Tax=Geranomyces variabilis TaxID=109894 RepID=A0AAD5TF31_9FUNG|nr:hypothetical protein HDU87_007583 [Geranomyces variabilis]
MDSPQHTVHTVLEPLLVASTADAPPAPAPAPLRPSRGKHRPCSCTCRAFCAAIILAFTLLFVAVAIATTYFFDPSEAFLSSDALYKESKAESFPAKPFYNESTPFDVYLQVQRTAEGADPVDVFAGRILTGTPLAGLQGDSVTLRLPALGPLNVSQPQPLAAQVAIVHSSHGYSVDDLFKLKPDHSAEGLGSAGAWATNSTSPPVFQRKVHLIRYLWRPVDIELVKFIYIDSSHLTTCEATMAKYFREAGWVLRSSGHEVLQGGSKRFKPRVEWAAVPKASLKHVQALYDGQQAMYGGNVKEFVARLNALHDQVGHERALYEEKPIARPLAA